MDSIRNDALANELSTFEPRPQPARIQKIEINHFQERDDNDPIQRRVEPENEGLIECDREQPEGK